MPGSCWLSSSRGPLDRGLVSANPCERGGRLYRGSRADKVWTDARRSRVPSAQRHRSYICLCCSPCGPASARAICCGSPGLPTTETTSDCASPRPAARVEIPVGAPLKAALDAAKSTRGLATTILVNSEGQPWTADGFRSSWRKACAKAGIVGLTFHDLRGSSVTRAALPGSTEAEIAYATGSRRAMFARSLTPTTCTGIRALARQRHPQARKENENSQLTAQLCLDVLCVKWEKSCVIKWLGDKDSNLD